MYVRTYPNKYCHANTIPIAFKPLLYILYLPWNHRYTMGSCAPGAIMPPWMTNVTDNTLTFKDPETLAYTELDTWGNPGGLGWGQGMRYGTALMFVDFAPVIQQTMSEVAFPFVILHDPEDKICGIEGSTALIEKSITGAHLKKLIEVRCNFRDPIPSYIFLPHNVLQKAE